MFERLKKDIIDELSSKGIDIFDSNYKKLDSYKEINLSLVKDKSHEFITLEEFIERNLLSKEEVMKTYESIYDLGNPYELSEEECEYLSIMIEILSKINKQSFDPNRGLIARRDNSYDLHEVNNDDIEEDAKEKLAVFTRKGGYIEQILKYLDIDLNKFEANNILNKQAKAKIFYFLYMLKNRHNVDILKFLSKPSMESIDNSFLDMKTYNGNIIKFIKASFEKEVNIAVKYEMKDILAKISTDWDIARENIFDFINNIYDNGYNVNFDEIVYSLMDNISKMDIVQFDGSYSHSPIEMFYLRILQHEYLGNINDILSINGVATQIIHEVPSELIDEMKNLAENKFDIDNIENYIDENAYRLSKYVFGKAKTHKEAVRRIKDNKTKIGIFLEFCHRAKPLLKIDEIANDLQMVSILQAILLDSSNEKLDYTFYNYEKFMKQKPSVQAALKRDKRKTNNEVLDAVQVYWVRKVVDHWYANMGLYDVRAIIRKFEDIYDNIQCEIFGKSSLEQMKELHNNYMEKINSEIELAKIQVGILKQFITYLRNKGFRYIDKNCKIHHVSSEIELAKIQVGMLNQFITYLRNKGFKYIDENFKIRHAFLNLEEMESNYNDLTYMIDETINDNDTLLEIEFETFYANDSMKSPLRFNLLFDYEKRECLMSNFNMS